MAHLPEQSLTCPTSRSLLPPMPPPDGTWSNCISKQAFGMNTSNHISENWTEHSIRPRGILMADMIGLLTVTLVTTLLSASSTNLRYVTPIPSRCSFRDCMPCSLRTTTPHLSPATDGLPNCPDLICSICRCTHSAEPSPR